VVSAVHCRVSDSKAFLWRDSGVKLMAKLAVRTGM
jgi:hypothetical protein